MVKLRCRDFIDWDNIRFSINEIDEFLVLTGDSIWDSASSERARDL